MSRRRVAGYAVAAVFLVLFGGRWVAIRFTEASWFGDLGLARPYWARSLHDLAWQLAVGAAAAIWYGAQTFAVYASIGAVHLPRRVGDLEIAEAVPQRTLRWIALGLALLLGVVTAVTFADVPDLVTLARHAPPLSFREPIFGRDASFYLATLPLLETLHLIGLALVLFGIFVASALYALTGSITWAARRLKMTPHARTHLVVLLTCLALVLAWGFQLDGYGLVGGGGSANGALSAADRAIRLPVSGALAALSLVVAGGSLATLRLKRAGVLLAAWATLAVVAGLGRFAAPYLWEAWRGRPDPEVALAMAQYADRYSRAGLGVLDSVDDRPLGARTVVPAESLAALGAELGGVSPWALEPQLLEAALGAAAPDTTRPRSWSVTIDAYAAAGAPPRLVALAVPETDQLALEHAARRPDWTALHRGPLSWAGEPVAVAAGAAGDGAPFFLPRPDAASGTTTPVPLSRAPGRIRYLAGEADPAIVGPDEPVPQEAPAGLRLGGFVRRLLLAWALQSPPLLDRRTSVADRLLIWRDVPRRLERLYPFASFDAPRAALVDGRLLWLADGYLASARFPLAEHVSWNGDAVNFLRAAFVATVDAVSGRTRLYLRPPDLALASALARGYGAVALPSDSLGPALAAHLGYPRQLFAAQVEMLARHRGDAHPAHWIVVRRESDDARAGAETGRPGEPDVALALLSIAGGPPALWRLAPLVDAAGNSLMAIAAGTTGPGGAPRLRLLRVDGGQFPTVAAASSRFASAPAVVAAVAGAAGPNGAVQKSAVAALPAAGTVAYLQFAFTSERRGQDPLLPRAVALQASGRIGIGDDLAGAALALAAGRGVGEPAAAAATTLAEARAAFAQLDSASRRGDWAAFARAYETLRRFLGERRSGAGHP